MNLQSYWKCFQSSSITGLISWMTRQSSINSTTSSTSMPYKSVPSVACPLYLSVRYSQILPPSRSKQKRSSYLSHSERLTLSQKKKVVKVTKVSMNSSFPITIIGNKETGYQLLMKSFMEYKHQLSSEFNSCSPQFITIKPVPCYPTKPVLQVLNQIQEDYNVCSFHKQGPSRRYITHWNMTPNSMNCGPSFRTRTLLLTIRVPYGNNSAFQQATLRTGWRRTRDLYCY